MKALVLAGGKGTRLRPLTHTSAKQLIPIANKPILFYGLEAIAAAGIKEVGIVIGDTGQEIKAAVGDGSQFGIQVTYIRQKEPRGLAHAALISEDFIMKDNAPGNFLMYLGDNLLSDGLAGIKMDGGNRILLAEVEHPEQFGVADIKDGKVVRLQEKPKECSSKLALVGVYLFDAKIFPAIDSIRPSERGELEITEAIQKLIDDGVPVASQIVNGWWKDTGKVRDLIDANRLVLGSIKGKNLGHILDSKIFGEVIIEEGATVAQSTIVGPAIIGKGAGIYSSYVGPYTSIGAGTKLSESEIEHSIVLELAFITRIGRISQSVIGNGSTISRGCWLSTTHRIVAGDNAQIEIHG